MGICDSDFAHKNDHSFFENYFRDLVRVSFCRAQKILLISSIGQHFTFLIIDDILGIMSIKIFIIQLFYGKRSKNYLLQKIMMIILKPTKNAIVMQGNTDQIRGFWCILICLNCRRRTNEGFLNSSGHSRYDATIFRPI